MLTQREIEEKAYDILEMVEMENRSNIDIIALARRYGFTVKNAQFAKEDIITIVKIVNHDKIIYVKKNLPNKAKRILISRAFSKYMLKQNEFIVCYKDSDIDSERLARALLMRKEIFSKIVYMSTYIGKPLYLMEKELANIFNTTRNEAKYRMLELRKASITLPK